MTRKGKRKSATVYLSAAVILACYLAQTIDCRRLNKTDRREGRKEADAAKTLGVQDGKIVFGRVFGNGLPLESQVTNGTKKSSSNASVEEEAAYQADFTGWSRGHRQDMDSKEAAWKRMVSSLQCGGDQLKFRAVGPGASQFEVEQGNAPPIPLSQVPSTCGYSMQRNSLALVMLVPYDGCNVVQEGGSYMLPMRWHGVPVSLWCPATAKPAATAPPPMFPFPVYPPYVPPFPWVFPEPLPATAKPTTKPQSNQFPPYLPFTPYPPPLFPPKSQYPTPEPEMTTTTATKTTPVPLTDTPLEDHPHSPPQVPFPFTPYPPHLLPYPQFPTPNPEKTRKTHIPLTSSPLDDDPHSPPQVPFPFTPYPPHFPPYPQFPTPKPETTKKTHVPLTGSPPAHHPHFPSQVPFPFPFTPYPL